MTAFIARPFRLQTARDLAFLLLGGVTAIVGFVIQVTGLSVGLSLLITFVGIPILLAMAVADRRLCAIERWRVGFVRGERVPAVYRRASRRGFIAWMKTVATDPQTWKDFGWVWLNIVLGFASAIVALSLVASVLWALTLPIYWWALPESARPELWTDARADTWGEVLGIAGLGVLLLPVVAAIVTGLERGQAWLAGRILGPSDRAELEERVGVLTRTRAAAADERVAADRARPARRRPGADGRGDDGSRPRAGEDRERPGGRPRSRRLGPRGGEDRDRGPAAPRRRHRPRCAHGPRPRRRALGARRLVSHPGLARRPAGGRGPTPERGRGGRLLRRLGGARQRAEALRGIGGHRPAAAAGRAARGRGRRRRPWRRRGVGAGSGLVGDPEVVRQLVARRGPLDVLSPREREVLELMAEGRSNAGIAEALVVTGSAVEKHVRQIFSKLRLAPAEGDHRRVLAVLAYLRSTS